MSLTGTASPCVQIPPIPADQLKVALHRGLPSLRDDYANLLACLTARQWQQSAELAHKLKGVSQLFGHTHLLELLSFIERQQLETVAHPDFLIRLQHVQADNIQSLEALASSLG